jgi:nucleoside-diphosphate-sugar epimerase
MHVLIVGLGSIGSQLATNLVAMGHQVTGLNRSPRSIAGVTSITQTVHQASLVQLPPVDWVYVVLTPDERTTDSYRHIFIDSIAPLHQALRQHPVQRVVFISSSSVYGSGQGEWMDESTPAQPDTPTAQVLWQAEQQWHQIWANKLVVVRPSGIYGPGRLRLIDWVKQGKPVKRNQWTNRIHSEDLIGFLAHLTTLTHIAPLYLATDRKPSLQHEVLEYLAQQLRLEKVTTIDAPVAGKRLRSQPLIDSGYVLKYPDYQKGYTMCIKILP